MCKNKPVFLLLLGLLTFNLSQAEDRNLIQPAFKYPWARMLGSPKVSHDKIFVTSNTGEVQIYDSNLRLISKENLKLFSDDPTEEIRSDLLPSTWDINSNEEVIFARAGDNGNTMQFANLKWASALFLDSSGNTKTSKFLGDSQSRQIEIRALNDQISAYVFTGNAAQTTFVKILDNQMNVLATLGDFWRREGDFGLNYETLEDIKYMPLTQSFAVLTSGAETGGGLYFFNQSGKKLQKLSPPMGYHVGVLSRSLLLTQKEI